MYKRQVQVFGSDLRERVQRLRKAYRGIVVEAQRTLTDPGVDDLFQAGERAADDEQDVGGVDLDVYKR